MEYDSRIFKRAMIALALMTLLTTELPYSDKAIIQHIVHFIASRFTDGASIYVTSIWAIPTIVASFWITFEIIRSKRFNINGFVIFMIMFFIIFPFIDKSTSFARSTFYMLNDGVNSIEMVDTSLHITDFDNEIEAFITLELKNYEELHDSIDIELILPKVTYECFEESTINIDTNHIAYSDGIAIIREQVTLTLSEGDDIDDLSVMKFRIHDYQILIQSETEKRLYIRNDRY